MFTSLIVVVAERDQRDAQLYQQPRRVSRTVKLAFHVADTDTDTDILAKILARKLRVSDVRMYRRVGRVGVGVGAVECELNKAT